MKLDICFFITLLLLSCGVISNVAFAENGLKLPQTRVIFNGDAKNASASIKNTGSSVYLVKAKIQNSPTELMQKETPPFIVIPPLFRLEPHSQQTVLIGRQGTESLPVDRESVFYLSFLAIPSSTKNSSQDEATMNARVAIGLETLIKVFYRPAKLDISIEDSSKELIALASLDKITLKNPTPYFQSLASLAVNGQPVDLSTADIMIDPYASRTYSVQGITQSQTVTWSTINDYGGISGPYTTTTLLESHQ